MAKALDQSILETSMTKLHDKPVWVRGDGDCLPTSILLSFLGAFRFNRQEFLHHAKLLFPQLPNEFSSYQEIFKLFNELQAPKNLRKLKTLISIFRKRIANFMWENQNMIFSELIINELEIQKNDLKGITWKNQTTSIKTQIKQLEQITTKVPKEQVKYYCQNFEKLSSWGGSPELIASTEFLNCKINIIIDNGENSYNQTYEPKHSNERTLATLNLHLSEQHYSYFLPSIETIQAAKLNNLHFLENDLVNLESDYKNQVFDETIYHNRKKEYEKDKAYFLADIEATDFEYALKLQKSELALVNYQQLTDKEKITYDEIQNQIKLYESNEDRIINSF